MRCAAGVAAAALQCGATSLVVGVAIAIAICWQCMIIAFVARRRWSIAAGAAVAVALPFADHSSVCVSVCMCVCV